MRKNRRGSGFPYTFSPVYYLDWLGRIIFGTRFFYAKIMPDYISMRFPLVPPSGVTEILAGAIFFFDPMSSIGAWGNMLMIVVFLTVHIHMIVHARRFANIPSRGQWLRLALPLPTVASARRLTRPAKSIAGSARA